MGSSSTTGVVGGTTTRLRRAMLLSRGDPFVFFQKPISLGFMIASAILLMIVALPAIRAKREEGFVEEQK